ncbi:hypothetical protein H2136_13065 [Aeromonas hydrophila]|uniref:Uncharacterized protein n=1 Tax=Aeromonas hydrophila TaxID=644 RepID=A0A926IZ22_AERHY|nr:hypothetical protein [Aeromonas hydrophila]
MLFTDVHDVEFLENLMGLGWLVQGAIARSGCLSEFSVSSQVHLPDNKKARWGQRAFLWVLYLLSDLQVQQRPHARMSGSVPPPDGQDGSRLHDKVL